MSKDYIRHLFALLADGRTQEFTQRGEEALKEIERDLADAQAQADFIRKALARHGAPDHSQKPLPQRVDKPRTSATGLDDSQKRAIREAADHLTAHNPGAEITIGEILEAVARKGINLTVAKPGAVVGSILSKWKDFTRTGAGKYKKVS